MRASKLINLYQSGPGQEIITRKDRIAFTSMEGLHLVPWKEILYCAAESNYCRIILTGGKTYLLSKTLKQVEHALSPVHFMRIHQTYLVQLRCIALVGQHALTLDNGTTLPVSRKLQQALIKRLKSMTTVIN